MQLERLEERVVLDTVTFAQFIHVGGSPQVFAYTNNGGTSADFGTISGGDAILLSFDPRFAPGLTTPQNAGPLTAHLFLTSHTTAPTIPPLPGDNLTREHFPAAANTIQILLDTPVDGMNNFLTVTYSDSLSGRAGSHEASLRATDAASGTPPDTVTFTSDFISFKGTINHGFSLSFSSVDSTDGSGGLQTGDGDFFKSFTAAATGTFDTNFSGAISGTKFQDTNGNGIRDPGEPGVPGWTIILDSVDGKVHLTTVTDANGNYSFTNLDPGVYRVSEAGRPGWVQITVNPGDITVVNGADVTGVDFGNFQLGSIAGQKFQDTNGDGLREPGEPGLAGWTIVLDAVNGTTHLTTVTDANGNYSFSNLLAGTYRVREVGQPGWVQTTVNPGDVTILSGTMVTGLDFGNFRLGGIAGQKFQDTNGNGMRDPGEPTLAGWTIVLDAIDGTTHLTTVTDANGNYSFANLPAGTYRVREVGQSGWVQTTVNPGDVTIVSGSNATGIDFGNFQLGRIAGLKFQDSNGNAVRDPGEPTLAGWTIVLDALDGSLHLTTVTDASGSYSFANLPAGTYRVREVNQPGWVQTTVNPGNVTIVSGSNVMGIDFGNQMPGMGPGMVLGTPPPPQTVTAPIPISKILLFAPNLMGMQNGLLKNDSAFINGLYQNVLDRAPDIAGLTQWVELLLAGVPRQQVAAAFWQSAEHRGLEVDQFYATFLGRAADAGGRAAWVNAFLAGAGEVDVIRAFVMSPEYQASHRSNVEFVNGMYSQILNRAGDPAGLAAWVGALQNGLDRLAMVQAFLTSVEADRRIVDDFYALFLNRRPDALGEQQWTDAMVHGVVTIGSLAEAMLASDEYFARVSRT